MIKNDWMNGSVVLVWSSIFFYLLISVKRQSHPVLGSLKFLYFLINVILQGILHFFNGID